MVPRPHRALKTDLGSLFLRAGDRVEPTPDRPDVGTLLSESAERTEVVFWRTSETHRILHKNPLFDSHIGITLDNLVIDPLHTLNLGVYKHFTVRAFWVLINADVWHVAEGRTAEERIALTVRCLRSDLVAFYKRYARAHPEQQLSEIQDLTPAMLGTSLRPKLRSKAAETKGLLIFADMMLERHRERIPQGGLWVKASKSLSSVLNLMQSSPMILSIGVVQDFG